MFVDLAVDYLIPPLLKLNKPRRPEPRSQTVPGMGTGLPTERTGGTMGMSKSW